MHKLCRSATAMYISKPVPIPYLVGDVLLCPRPAPPEVCGAKVKGFHSGGQPKANAPPFVIKAASVGARRLTSRLSRAKSAAEIASLIDDEVQAGRRKTLLNPIHVSTALNRIAKHGGGNRILADPAIRAAVASLEEHILMNAGPPILAYKPQALSVSADGLSKLKAFRALDAICRAAVVQLPGGGFNAQDIALIANAFTRRAASVDFEADVAKRQVELSSRNSYTDDIGNGRSPSLNRSSFVTTRNQSPALSSSSHTSSDAELYALLASAALPILGTFSAQNLSNVAHAFAKSGHVSVELFDALAIQALRKLESEFTPQNVAMTAWAFSKAGHRNATSTNLFNGIEKVVIRAKLQFKPSDIAILAWTFASADRHSPKLFAALERAARGNLNRFSPRDLSNLAWGFATVAANPQAGWAWPQRQSTLLFSTHPISSASLPTRGVTSPESRAGALMSEIGANMCRRLPDFGTHAIASTLLALAKTDTYNPDLFDVASAHVSRAIPDFSIQSLCATVSAFAMTRHTSDDMFHLVATRVLDDVGLRNLNPSELSAMAWSYAYLMTPDVDLLHAIAHHALTAPPELWVAGTSAQDLALIIWALAVCDKLMDHTLLASLTSKLESKCVLEKLDTQSLHALYQVGLLLNGTGEQAGGTTALPLSVQKAAEAAWVGGAANVRPSRLQLDVLHVLAGMGERCHLEWRTPRSGLSVDIMVEAGGVGPIATAIEVDGPTHFTRSSPRRETGPTFFKRRLLQKCWPEGRIVTVPYHVWDQLRDDEEAKRSFLESLLLA